MSITLIPAPPYTQFSTGHYSEDNARLDQLNTNDALLAAQLDSLGGTSSANFLRVGNWESISFNIPFPTLAINTSVAATIKAWGIEDSSTTSAQNSFIGEFTVFGYKDGSGNFNILDQSLVYIKNIGTKIAGLSFSIQGNQFVGVITGFTGANGRLQVKIDYFN